MCKTFLCEFWSNNLGLKIWGSNTRKLCALQTLNLAPNSYLGAVPGAPGLDAKNQDRHHGHVRPHPSLLLYYSRSRHLTFETRSPHFETRTLKPEIRNLKPSTRQPRNLAIHLEPYTLNPETLAMKIEGHTHAFRHLATPRASTQYPYPNPRNPKPETRDPRLKTLWVSGR